jgi:predicted  nucleic acid-binding Zn-ribbon protein
MTDSEKFESLKQRVDSIKVKRLAAEAEAKRLSEELEKSKKEIKDTYGVEITDFAQAIETMKKERDAKLTELEKLVSEAEEKIGGAR